MGANSEIAMSLKKIKKEIKKIEVLLEYQQKKKLINKILDIKYQEQEENSENSETESEEEEEESDMETSSESESESD
jgi:hypothetical protein